MRALWTVTLFLVLAPCIAHAQLPDVPPAPSDEDVSRARDHFVRGIELAQSERWEPALDEFLRSYALSGSPAALFNAASAMRALERFREAREGFDRLLADRELDAETRQAAETLRREAAAHVARVTVHNVPTGMARPVADGEERDASDARPVEVEVDPGTRTLKLELPGHLPWSWTGLVPAGARLNLDAELIPEPSGGGDDALGWALGGLAAVVVGALVALIVVDLEAQLDPRTPLVITLP